MIKEKVEFIKTTSEGEKAMGKGDFSKAFYHFVRDGDIKRLKNLAMRLEAQGRLEERDKVKEKVDELRK